MKYDRYRRKHLRKISKQTGIASEEKLEAEDLGKNAIGKSPDGAPTEAPPEE